MLILGIYNWGIPHHISEIGGCGHQLGWLQCHLSPLEICVQWEILLGGASFVSLAGQHTFCWQNCDNQAVICKHKCLYISYRAHIDWIFLLKKHEHLWKISQRTFSRLSGLLKTNRKCGDPPNIRPSAPNNKSTHCTHFKGCLWYKCAYVGGMFPPLNYQYGFFFLKRGWIPNPLSRSCDLCA